MMKLWIATFNYLIQICHTTGHTMATGILLQKYTCVEVSDLPHSLTFTQVVSTTNCAVLCMDQCVAMAIIHGSDSPPQCALMTRQDFPASSSSCDTTTPTTAVIYKQMTSVSTLNIDGQCHCLSDEGTSTRYTNSEKACSDIGGQMPEVRTIADILDMYEFASGTSHQWTGRFWMSAREQDAGSGNFSWSSGQTVDDVLWFPGQPDTDTGATEPCTALQVKQGQVLLHDVRCSAATAFNVICAVVGCMGC